VEGTVDERVLRFIAEDVQSLDNFLDDVVVPIVENVGDVLHQDRKGLYSLYVVQIPEEEITSRVDLVGRWVLVDLPQLGAADAGVSLAWRPADQHVDAVVYGTQAEFVAQLVGLDLRHIPRRRVQL
jgi:hypothetical protein